MLEWAFADVAYAGFRKFLVTIDKTVAEPRAAKLHAYKGYDYGSCRQLLSGPRSEPAVPDRRQIRG
jgi:hypothetical protein